MKTHGACRLHRSDESVESQLTVLGTLRAVFRASALRLRLRFVPRRVWERALGGRGRAMLPVGEVGIAACDACEGGAIASDLWCWQLKVWSINECMQQVC